MSDKAVEKRIERLEKVKQTGGKREYRFNMQLEVAFMQQLRQAGLPDEGDADERIEEMWAEFLDRQGLYDLRQRHWGAALRQAHTDVETELEAAGIPFGQEYSAKGERNGNETEPETE